MLVVSRSGMATATRHAPLQQRMELGDWTDPRIPDGYVQRLALFDENEANMTEVALGYSVINF